MNENAVAVREIKTLDDLFDSIKWAHNRRRAWDARTTDVGWIIEVEVLGGEDVDDIGGYRCQE